MSRRVTRNAGGVRVPRVAGIARASHPEDRQTYCQAVDAKKEIREFLTTRRARITPQSAGLPTFGDRRRVPGLRREEVAMLSGVSVDYYTKLERGNARGVSDSVLDAIARALRLDEAERSHLFDLVRANGRARPVRRQTGGNRVRPSVHRILMSLNESNREAFQDLVETLEAAGR